MSNKFKEEHRQIADFTRDTVFPLIDAFVETHTPTLNAESGVLVLLVQRMVYQGFSPDAVASLSRRAAEMTQEKQEAATAPVEAPPTSVVLPFRWERG